MLNSIKIRTVLSLILLYISAMSYTCGQVRTVVLDAGHGGKDPGAKGVTGALEKTINLKIILALGKKIKEDYPDVKVIYTRMTDNFIPLKERSDIANRNKADLFISVHCNANPYSSSLHGTETYVMGLHKTEDNLDVAKRENAVILQENDYKKTYKGYDPNSPLANILLANYQNAFLKNSLRLAEKVEKEFKRSPDRQSRGVKQAGFLVLWTTTMPSILIEAGYLTHKDEEKYLKSEDGQDATAEYILKAFKKYKESLEGL
jgi:N-acetylmuramoyl-L-alanine amidase